jgi:PKD domain/Secretion system C-terminal sorting domain
MVKYFITRIVIVSMAILFSNIESTSQKNDYNWLFGLDSDDATNPITGADTLLWGATNFDFNHDPVRIYRDKNRYTDFLETNASYSLGDGKLFSYSNGHHIYAADDSIIEGGDSTLYGEYWDLWVIKKENSGLDYDWLTGFKVPQSILYLPSPRDKNNVYMINQFNNFNPIRNKSSSNSLHYSLINTEANQGKGLVLNKDVKILDTILSYGYVQATKHGNGRDWWITVLGYKLTKIYSILLDTEGFHLIHQDTLDIGWTGETISGSPFGWSGNSWGQSVFSQDGNKYAMLLRVPWSEANPFHTIVMDFDRCTGKFSNLKRAVLTQGAQDVYYMGMALSPSGQYLYTGNGVSMYQFDLTKPNLQTSMRFLARYDGFLSVFDRTTEFYRWLLAPDGRLYGTAQSGSCSHMHVINFPDERVNESQLVQHAIKLPTSCANGMPNFVNYRLGPLDGSPCDTLAIDNHPIAKYRYEPDTIDHLRLRFTDLSYYRPETWSWDFGDGSPQENTRHPYHSYAASGTYNVCLTVSNENSSNTSCRTITIGTSSVDDSTSTAVADITLFPNPVEDFLLVTLGEYIPQHGQIAIYDISGRPVRTQRIYYGQNTVDMTGLVAGMYVWKVMDGKVEIRSGKVVKM